MLFTHSPARHPVLVIKNISRQLFLNSRSRPLYQQQILFGVGIPNRIIGHTWPHHHSSSRSALYPPVLPTCPHQHQQSETGHSQCRWPSPSTLCTPRPTSLSVLANKTITSQLVIHCHSSQHLSLMRPLYQH